MLFRYPKYLLLTVLLFTNSNFTQSRPDVGNISESYGTGSNFLLDFYQKVISPIKGSNNCAMYPSCSQYSKLLFNNSLFYKAYIGTFDRIMRCGHELYLHPEVNVNGFIKWYDPAYKLQGVSENGYNVDSTLYKNTTPLNKEFTINSTADTGFAYYLLSSGDYERASTEFLRLWFYENDSLKKNHHLQMSGLSLFKGTKYYEYICFTEKFNGNFSKDLTIKSEVEIYLGESYYYTQNYHKAITTFTWCNIDTTNPLRNDLNYFMGLSYARIFDWQTAFKYFNKVDIETENGPPALRLRNHLLIAEDLPECKPWLAGLSSAIIPGLGYLYARRPGTALTSFIINTLLIYSLSEAINKENYGLAVTIGIFGSGWYLGNIYGSNKAALEYNSYIRNKYIDDLLNDKVALEKLK